MCTCSELFQESKSLCQCQEEYDCIHGKYTSAMYIDYMHKYYYYSTTLVIMKHTMYVHNYLYTANVCTPVHVQCTWMHTLKCFVTTIQLMRVHWEFPYDSNVKTWPYKLWSVILHSHMYTTKPFFFII